MEGIPERQSSPIWYRVVCLLYELVLSHEYRNALDTQRFRINFVVFEINEEEVKLLASSGRVCRNLIM